MSINKNFPPLKNDRILKAARGEKPDKLPLWIMRQAGRYLPEFQEYRKQHSFFEICQNPEHACEVTLMPLRRFDLDASIIFSDILVIPQALGLQVEMRPGVGPVLPDPLTPEKLSSLTSEGAVKRLEYVGRAINLTRHKIEGKVPLFGFTGAPWTLMGYMIEGGGSKTYSKAKKWLYAHPEKSHFLIGLLTDVIIDYLVMQIEYGAQIVQVFDSNAEYLNKDLYSTFCLPSLKKISEEVRRKLKEKKLEEVPMVLFSKGGWYCLEEQADLGYEVLGVDWTIEPKYVRNILKNKNITIQGNLDPCALYAPQEELKKTIQKMLEEFGSDRYIVNLGHGIYPDGPIESVETFVKTVHNFKQLHSEYRSTYRWHEYTGPRQEVVRKPPVVNGVPAAGGTHETHEKPYRDDDFQTDSAAKQEPVMPRRKKYPDLAYRHHEFLSGGGGMTANGGVDSRARSEERFGPNWRPSRRSKSEGPRRAIEPETEPGERRRESDSDVENMVKDQGRRYEGGASLRTDGRENGLLRKAISKISTEYRRQFAWPPGHTSRRDEVDGAPRKSQSMGALKANAHAMIHKKRIDNEHRDASELEPLVDDRSNQEKSKEEFNSNSEYKKQFRPFNHYQYINGRFSTKRPVVQIENVHKDFSADLDNDASWYREVVELRKKAGEYKHRGWGSELAPERLSDIYNKQVELWDQVSRRSSLSALSLASHMTNKSYTKEDKEEDNNRKSSPTKAYRNAENNARMIRDIIRHHLERTTGGTEIDGLILSPTREKLEPTIPRKDDDSRGSQKNSPKKSSPLKITAKRGSQKGKEGATNTLRSQSVGPTTETSNKEKQSPKRQSRSTVKEGRKSTSNTPSSNKRPRPSSLNTTVSSRSKSSSVVTKNEDDRLAKSNKNKTLGTIDSSKQNRKGNYQVSEQPKSENSTGDMRKNQENEQPDSIEYEPVIKSPPEPTRVKSPEQIIMRSPDPVNWTVPLDTGKTFTVTQNVRDGDPSSRPQSEVKAWTPPEVPPPVAQSAPPTLAEGQSGLS